MSDWQNVRSFEGHCGEVPAIEIGDSDALGRPVLISACDDTVVRLFELVSNNLDEDKSQEAEVKRLQQEVAKRDERIAHLETALESEKRKQSAVSNKEHSDSQAELCRLRSELSRTLQKLASAEQSAKRKFGMAGADEVQRLKSELSVANQKLQVSSAEHLPMFLICALQAFDAAKNSNRGGAEQVQV